MLENEPYRIYMDKYTYRVILCLDGEEWNLYGEYRVDGGGVTIISGFCRVTPYGSLEFSV